MAATTPGIPDSVLELIKYVHRYGLLFIYKRAICDKCKSNKRVLEYRIFFFFSPTRKNNDISLAVFATFRSISHMHRVN